MTVIDREEVFEVTIPAETAEAAPVVVPTHFNPGTVVEVELIFPAGAAGLAGVRVVTNRAQIWPRTRGAWFVGDNEQIKREVYNWPNSGRLELEGYNTGKFSHSFQVRYGIVENAVERAPLTAVQSGPVEIAPGGEPVAVSPSPAPAPTPSPEAGGAPEQPVPPAPTPTPVPPPEAESPPSPPPPGEPPPTPTPSPEGGSPSEPPASGEPPAEPAPEAGGEPAPEASEPPPEGEPTPIAPPEAEAAPAPGAEPLAPEPGAEPEVPEPAAPGAAAPPGPQPLVSRAPTKKRDTQIAEYMKAHHGRRPTRRQLEAWLRSRAKRKPGKAKAKKSSVRAASGVAKRGSVVRRLPAPHRLGIIPSHATKRKAPVAHRVEPARTARRVSSPSAVRGPEKRVPARAPERARHVESRPHHSAPPPPPPPRRAPPPPPPPPPPPRREPEHHRKHR